jgi:hypothetical protein
MRRWPTPIYHGFIVIFRQGLPRKLNRILDLAGARAKGCINSAELRFYGGRAHTEVQAWCTCAGAVLPTLTEANTMKVPAAKLRPAKSASESFLSKIFKAKSCIYCGEPISLFSSKHGKCGVPASRPAEIISEQIARYLEEGDATYIGKDSISTLATQDRLSDAEIKSAVQQGCECAIRNILSQRILLREEEARFSQLISDWNFQKTWLVRGWPRIIQSLVIRDLLEGKVPGHSETLNPPVPLGKNETCVWIFSGVDVYERKTRRAYENHHVDLSVPIARGIYFRDGVYRGHPVDHVCADQLGRGDLMVTTKNVLFLIGGQTKKLSVKKIVSANPHSDGITLKCGGKRAPQYSVRRLDPWFAYNLIVNLSAVGSFPDEVASDVSPEKKSGG